MKGRTVGSAPDYTNAFLVSLYLVLLIGLVVVWAVWGYPVALIAASLVHAYIAKRIHLRHFG